MVPFRLKEKLDQMTEGGIPVEIFDGEKRLIGVFYRELSGEYEFHSVKGEIYFDRYTVDPPRCSIKLFNGSIPVGKVYCHSIFLDKGKKKEE